MIPIPEKRIKNFEELGMGMFAHWGLYSQLGIGEWAMKLRHIPKDEYMKLVDTFTACDFDADEFVLTAKAAGAKYIVLTTRHHDGFSLYDTCGLNEYDAPHSPAGRDLIREYVDACNRHGILPLFYHTTLDWWNDLYNTDFDAYLEYLNASVEILCTKYGKIGGLWFDGNWDKKQADWKEDKLYAIIRKHQPDAIIVNNSGMDAMGKVGNPELDSTTFEQGRPEPLDREGMSKYLAVEMCETINDHWGYGSCDFNNKSSAELIKTFCACRKVGANYLLNVGPMAQGGIQPIQKYTMQALGDWIKMHEIPSRLAKPCGIKGAGDDFALKFENKLYFFVDGIGIGGDEHVTVACKGEKIRKFDGVNQKIKSIKWMDNNEPLEFTQNNDGTMSFKATNFPYGVNLVMRVAEAEIE